MQYNIILVHESCAVKNEIAGILAKYNMDILGARNEKELLEVLSQYPSEISAVVWYAETMGYKQFEMIRRFRYLDHYKYIPIIVISPSNDKSSIMKVIDSGADEFIVYPFKETTLVRKIGKVLGLTGDTSDSCTVEDVVSFCFSEMLNKEIKGASRGGYPLTIMALALKTHSYSSEAENTAYEVLDIFSTVLKANLRDTDTVFNSNYSYLVALLPFADKTGAEVVRQKVYELFETHSLIRSKCKDIELISASVTFPDDGKIKDKLLEQLKQYLEDALDSKVM